uniref:NADH-ubiquinone oxidoreductase chain 3 n=1 Tax=Myrianida brachycephala TaxID=884646 RepID=A0A1C9UZD0_MYRBC|nr:NADH dehydrogenase subunit 3 [Myrianida brachycephala]AOR87124.1 NADH dehydrogenase subunit 3 [Myrianida brachycephala]
MLFSIILMFLPLVILMLSLILTMRSNPSREKLSPFECGFDPTSSSRIPFSLRFFLLMVLFLVFDIEIVLLLPLPLTILNTPMTFMFIPTIYFIFILLLGLFHEWNEGSLEWAD